MEAPVAAYSDSFRSARQCLGWRGTCKVPPSLSVLRKRWADGDGNRDVQAPSSR